MIVYLTNWLLTKGVLIAEASPTEEPGWVRLTSAWEYRRGRWSAPGLVPRGDWHPTLEEAMSTVRRKLHTWTVAGGRDPDDVRHALFLLASGSFPVHDTRELTDIRPLRLQKERPRRGAPGAVG